MTTGDDEPPAPSPIVRPPERLFTTWMTARDGRDHAITDEEFTEHRPEPGAVCGAVVQLAPMEAPPGPRCPRCEAFLAARESMRTLDERLGARRHRKPSWLERLLHPTVPRQRADTRRAEVDA